MLRFFARSLSQSRTRKISNAIDMVALRSAKRDEIVKLPEVIQRTKFIEQLKAGNCTPPCEESSVNRFKSSGMTEEEVKVAITAAFATFALHVEARIASNVGQGFYTIGPCGEELLAAVGCILRGSDSSALHYRHVATVVARQLMQNGGSGSKSALESILLDRARGYTCSSLDPVTGGKHCAIGGSSTDFIVTSTLSSQAPPAVGRALGIGLSNFLSGKRAVGDKENAWKPVFPADAVSYVSLGDGSMSNAHFLAALNLAEYAKHRKFKCPVVFGVSNNDVSISLKNNGWFDKFLAKYEGNSENPPAIQVFHCSGNDIFDIYQVSKIAFQHARKLSDPVIIAFHDLPRRFGHAATDRQSAYLSASEIASAAEKNPIAHACADIVAAGIMSYSELSELFTTIVEQVENAFNVAANEAKISSVESLIAGNSAPLAYIPLADKEFDKVQSKEAMRKHMTSVYDEFLRLYDDVVYIGEDVQHGGYYLVTDGLAAKYPARVCDFPPDETTLVGAGMGYRQCGLMPIVEIPYGKYLVNSLTDCGADMFLEAVITYWLTNGRQKDGIFFRLQGFDKGVFGGNFHTHNMLQFPPGLDVVCYSNGQDYVRGIRYCMRQARAGRVVMSVDSTDLLNRRHIDVSANDGRLLSTYPAMSVAFDMNQYKANEMTFDEVVCYASSPTTVHNRVDKKSILASLNEIDCIIVSYGNGVPSSLLAAEKLKSSGKNVVVIDTPYLTSPPAEIVEILKAYSKNTNGSVLFADVCKFAAGMPYMGYVSALQSSKALPSNWRVIGAANTYNPLSRVITFLNESQIVSEVDNLLKRA